MGYTSRTGTKTTLAMLRASGWKLLISATGVWRDEGFRYAIDNGAWTAHQQKKAFDEDLFRGLVEKMGHGADWVVAPDIVAGGIQSLAYTERWLPELADLRLVLIAVQDGMTVADVASVIGKSRRLGIFLGGSTEWKLQTMNQWGRWCKDNGYYYHVGRVNSAKRVRACRLAHAHSFDGTGPILFPSTVIPLLDKARKEYIPCLNPML
jgi:hypothetical protein